MIPRRIPIWVIDLRKEIKRLNRKIAALEKKRDNDEVDEIDALEDISNWSGWRDALEWTLKMRVGKSSRRAVWGKA